MDQHLRLETLGIPDTNSLVRLSAAVGWDYDAAEIGTLLAVGRLFGHKTAVGDAVSSAAVVPYAPDMASLGMVIVHPDFRRCGLGEAVTAAARHVMVEGSCVALVSTPEGRPLYDKMGFEVVSVVHKYVRRQGVRGYPGTLADRGDVVTLRRDDLERVIPLDAQAFGVDRSEFLRHRVRQASAGWMLVNDSQLVGYALGVKGSVNWILGPVVARDDEAATQLVAQTAQLTTDGMRIDVPAQHADWAARELPRWGFTKVAAPPVMTYQGRRLPSGEGLYALAAQVFG